MRQTASEGNSLLPPPGEAAGPMTSSICQSDLFEEFLGSSDRQRRQQDSQEEMVIHINR